MYEYLYQYFTLYKKLSLPGIGVFTLEEKPSGIDVSEKKIYPSKQTTHFNLETIPADKNLFIYLANVLRIDEIQAIQKFTNYTHALKAQLNAKGSASFPGIGILTKQFTNTYSFSPQAQKTFYLQPINAERVLRKNATHKVKVGEEEKTSSEMIEILTTTTKKEKWWIAAVILAAAGIAAIYFYYSQNRF